MKLGIDCGGVLMANYDREQGRNIRFSTSFLEFPAIEGALASVRSLIEIFGQEQVFLVSKVSPEREAGLREWLVERGFVDETGFLEDNLYFCPEGSDKAGICADLEITHFIDNRLEILEYLTTVPHLYLFQPAQVEIEGFAGTMPAVEYTAETWPELVEKVREATSYANR